jgi:electron transfer flavoprotein alpha subunit
MLSRVSSTSAAATIQRVLSNTNRRCWASTLVVSEPLGTDGSTPAATLSTVTAATKLGNADIDLLVVGSTPPTKIPAGVKKVYHVPIGDKLSETVANAIEMVANTKNCNIVVGSSSKFGSAVIPRAAAQLDVSPVTDILSIEDPCTLTGYFYYFVLTQGELTLPFPYCIVY